VNRIVNIEVPFKARNFLTVATRTLSLDLFIEKLITYPIFFEKSHEFRKINL
jgi:hypothetical protein